MQKTTKKCDIIKYYFLRVSELMNAYLWVCHLRETKLIDYTIHPVYPLHFTKAAW